MDKTNVELVKAMRDPCQDKGIMIVTAESCTGGLIAAAITAVAGAADFFERGFVTYSNEAKTDLLGVPEKLIETHGAVSAEVAKAMAEGAMKNSRAHLSVSVTGIAGPSGATETKPIGRVYIGSALKGYDTIVQEFNFGDIGRENVQTRTVQEALKLISARLMGDALPHSGGS